MTLPLHGITMFRARDDDLDLDDLLPARTEVGRLQVEDYRLSDGSVGLVYYERTPTRPPRWASFLRGIVDPEHLASASSSAVITFQREDRWYFVTFGYGRYLLDLDLMEPTFGLKVTLNGIDPSKIRSIDKKRVDIVARLTREQLSRDSRIGSFGLDVHQDLLSAVTGVPSDPELGTRLYGKDAVGLRIDTRAEHLGEIADHLELLFLEEAYRDHFPWVDNIAEVRGGAEISALDRALLVALEEDDHGFDLAPPEMVDWERAERFVWDRQDGDGQVELRLSDYFDLVRGKEDLSLETLKSDRVRLLDGDGNRMNGWSTYRCLSGELVRDGGVYVISDGKWYRIDRDFAEEVDEVIARLTGAAVKLPTYRPADEDEAAYNNRAANESDGEFCCMDREYVWPRSWQDRIEFCDLYRNDLTMVHVKKFTGGSATLSHLFAQGSVSLRCLLTDRAFRADVNEKLYDGFEVSDDAPGSDECHVVYGIVTQPEREPHLPFFARVALRNAAESIEQMGARVTYQAIRHQV